MKKYFTILFLLLGSLANAQGVPVKFQEGLISKGGEFGLTISPDSQTALWVESNGKRDTLIIKESKKVNGVWQKPITVSFSSADAKWKDVDPIFSPDGNMVLFQSTRSVQGKPERKGFDIWAVKKTTTGWGEPYHLGNTINTDASESYASIAVNGNIYFMKENENKVGNSDLYVSKLVSGIYQTPENIGLPINTIDHRESNPFISADEKFILYFSSDPSGFGEVDLFISFNKNGSWSSPKNIGKPFNSELAEFCPFYHAKEKKLYFSRQRKTENRMWEDLYVVDFDPKQYETK